MYEPKFHFEWNERKAAANARKHGVSFRLASTAFNDPLMFTVADLEHSRSEDRWFSVGRAENGILLAIIYLWSQVDPKVIKIRIISARKPAATEIRQYNEGI